MTEKEYEQKFILLRNLPGVEERGAHAVELLEKKYGKEFGYIEVRPMDVNDDYYKVITYSFDNPELLFESRVSLDGETLMDEFAVRSACDEYCNSMLERISSLNGYLYLKMRSLIRGFELDNTDLSVSKIQDINSNNSYIFDVFYTEDENNTDDLYSTLNAILSEDNKIDGIMNIYIVPEKIREKAQIYLESHDKIYMDFAEVIENNRPLTVDIEKGKISLSKEKWEERMGMNR